MRRISDSHKIHQDKNWDKVYTRVGVGRIGRKTRRVKNGEWLKTTMKMTKMMRMMNLGVEGKFCYELLIISHLEWRSKVAVIL